MTTKTRVHRNMGCRTHPLPPTQWFRAAPRTICASILPGLSDFPFIPLMLTGSPAGIYAHNV